MLKCGALDCISVCRHMENINEPRVRVLTSTELAKPSARERLLTICIVGRCYVACNITALMLQR
jgi:hypothetical protein